jgi:hypothetical protein
MKILGRALALLVTVIIFAGGCSVEQGVDREKFKKVSAAARAVESGLASGSSYQRFGELLQDLSLEISALKGSAASGKEQELLRAYEVLLGVYQDGHTLWKYKLEFAPFGFVPPGRIYVSQDVDPIAFKYNFPTESHLYAPTHQYWKSISEDSLRIIWSNADAQLRIIEGIVHS